MRKLLLPTILTLVCVPAGAVRTPDHRAVDEMTFRNPELVLGFDATKATQMSNVAGSDALRQLGVSAQNAFVDRGTGRFAALRPTTSLVPGRGVGNTLAWSELGLDKAPSTASERQAAVWDAFHAYLERNASALDIDLSELVIPGHVVEIRDQFFNIYVQRQVNGILVRDAHIAATVKYGNLILLGLQSWGDLSHSAAAATRSADEALDSLRDRLTSAFVGNEVKAPRLEWIPINVGGRLDYRLCWVLLNDLAVDGGQYEALVDARNGEVYSVQDEIQWAASHRRVSGGVFPVSNDGVNPDGQEQASWPMPFSRVTAGPDTYFTDIGGNLPVCVDGSITAQLSGTYFLMSDTCGAASLSGTGDLDWGTNAGTDCTTPGTGGTGNTHASRTGYHELNMINAMARSHLPENEWLQTQVQSNMNIALTCNAFWNGSSVNFYKSGGGCFNTGEIAAIFDHEWGHGIDDNDAVPSIALPGEAVADIYGSFRLDTSCIGRGFRATPCNGYGDVCIGCTGVRDIDYANHVSGLPAQIGGSPLITSCPAQGSRGPCNLEVHCEGMAPAEAVWDLWNRELTAAPYNMSLNSAREIGAQLTYNGATGASAWYTCDSTGPDFTGGCGATMSYQKFVAADDDDGNLANGTPHWQAIYDAFNSHKVGCSTDSPIDFGCASGPTGAPTVTATARDQGVDLTWTSVPNADSYKVFRTDGVFQCDFGKILVATVQGTQYRDTGLQNGRAYSYVVMPVGAAEECLGAASSCSSATPSSAGGGAVLVPNPALATVTPSAGDSDPFLDNCETAQISVPVSNSGGASLTNVRIVAAHSPSHPSSVVLSTLPVVVSASLAPCAVANANVNLMPIGLAAGETFEVDLYLTSNEIAPSVIPIHVTRSAVEGDFVFVATKTYSFESNTEGWTTTEGTFVRANAIAGPAGGGTFYEQSSANLDNQCDAIESPVIRLGASSTMSMQNHFVIEAFSGGQWWDRANIGVVTLDDGVRHVVSPGSGRAYNASGTGGDCGTANQPGWAGSNGSWAASTWSATDLQTGTLAGETAQLSIRYGTDSSVNGSGFRFDLLTLTNFDEATADTQSNACVSTTIFIDGFGSGDVSAWTSHVP